MSWWNTLWVKVGIGLATSVIAWALVWVWFIATGYLGYQQPPSESFMWGIVTGGFIGGYLEGR